MRRKPSLKKLLQNVRPFANNLHYWVLDDVLRSGRRNLLNRFVSSLTTVVGSPFERKGRERGPVDVTKIADRHWTSAHHAFAQRYFGDLHRYVPRYFPGVVTLFRTRTQAPLSFAHQGLDLGWSDVAERVDVSVVARCKHHQLVHEPHIQKLVKALEEELRLVDRRS